MRQLLRAIASTIALTTRPRLCGQRVVEKATITTVRRKEWRQAAPGLSEASPAQAKNANMHTKSAN